MSPAEGIRKLGFRRWYERELIEGHVYFVTCFLSMIVAAVCLEQIDWRQPLQELGIMMYAFGGVLLCLFSLRRYQLLLVRAESLGQQSTCARCSTYGVLHVLDAATADEAKGAPDNAWIRVRCKKCGYEWRMDN